jgi:hypothetical protein
VSTGAADRLGGRAPDCRRGAVRFRVRRDDALVFKVADGDAEFEAIHRLNYRSFVEEIPQHAPNAQRR